eukprot:CAMPEP_0167760724 /NCGR_PEP_ID=MMETSP0110_2-20121227/11744_1 /TAXON_ID=629695 /ORGANISM="Gymnochlora sp., Strain CCMP2014" /LENGTH=209 /DNA_ID=CAMNT_0007647265 /DNA_START=386 /DNA_END=1015 /DNA_ORIENTATION=+
MAFYWKYCTHFVVLGAEAAALLVFFSSGEMIESFPHILQFGTNVLPFLLMVCIYFYKGRDTDFDLEQIRRQSFRKATVLFLVTLMMVALIINILISYFMSKEEHIKSNNDDVSERRDDVPYFGKSKQSMNSFLVVIAVTFILTIIWSSNNQVIVSERNNSDDDNSGRENVTGVKDREARIVDSSIEYKIVPNTAELEMSTLGSAMDSAI